MADQTNCLLTASQYTRILPFDAPAGYSPALSLSERNQKYSGIRIAFTNDNNVPKYTLSPYGTMLQKAKTVAVLNVEVPSGQWLGNFKMASDDVDDNNTPDFVYTSCAVPKGMNIDVVYADSSVIAGLDVVPIYDIHDNSKSGVGIRITVAPGAVTNVLPTDTSFMRCFPVSIKLVSRLIFRGSLRYGPSGKSTENDEFYVVEYHALGPPTTYNVFTITPGIGAGFGRYDTFYSIVIDAVNDGNAGLL